MAFKSLAGKVVLAGKVSRHKGFQDLPQQADLKTWAGDVCDLHRALDVVFHMYLMLEQHNEALLRVALELVTCNPCRRVLTWDRDAWYNDDSKREWFRSEINKYLGEVVLFRNRKQKSMNASSSNGFRQTGQKFRRDSRQLVCPKCEQCEQQASQKAEEAAAASAIAVEMQRELSEVRNAAAHVVGKLCPNAVARASQTNENWKIHRSEIATETGAFDGNLAGDEARRLISKLEAALRESRQQASVAEARVQAAEERVRSAEASAQDAEVRARDAEKENKQLKVGAEELQMKLKGFIKQIEKQAGDSGDPKLCRLIEDTGFSVMINGKNVWDRLYDEALERIERLRELRAAYAAKTNIDPLGGIDILEALSGSTLIIQASGLGGQSQVIRPFPDRVASPKAMLGKDPVKPTFERLQGESSQATGLLQDAVRRQKIQRKVVRCFVGDDMRIQPHSQEDSKRVHEILGQERQMRVISENGTEPLASAVASAAARAATVRVTKTISRCNTEPVLTPPLKPARAVIRNKSAAMLPGPVRLQRKLQ
jgi:hypothetical protein